MASSFASEGLNNDPCYEAFQQVLPASDHLHSVSGKGSLSSAFAKWLGTCCQAFDMVLTCVFLHEAWLICILPGAILPGAAGS